MTDQNKTNSSFMGSPPMVKIDGNKIRQCRETKGLTQLYMATVVGVTTDTISRWENRRYPSIKKENAIKLAEALETSLEDILDLDEPETDQPQEPLPIPAQAHTDEPISAIEKKGKYRLPLYIATVVFILAMAWWFTSHSPVQKIQAYRIMPSHVPAGEIFPVIIHIESKLPTPESMILKETLPPGCTPVKGFPEFSPTNQKNGTVNWISKIGPGKTTFAYLVQTDPDLERDAPLTLSGELTLRSVGKAKRPVDGSTVVSISPYHWADANSDNKINDEEILSVYDTFAALDNLGYNWSLIDEIWSGARYRWDEGSEEYDILR